MTLVQYETLVDSMVRDTAGDISLAERDNAIQLAVEQYSRDRGNLIVKDVVTAFATTILVPSEWEDDFSELVSVEYPAGDNPPSLWDQEAWSVYQAPGGPEIRLGVAVPTGSVVRLGFTVRQTLSGAADTIPSIHREGVAAYAAALLLQQLAARFAGSSEPTIGADSVDHGSRSGTYERRAKALVQRYERIVGVVLNRVPAAGAVVNLQGRDSRGNDRLVHKRQYR